MKKSISILTIFAIAFAIFFSSCEKNEDLRPSGDSILPQKFSVDIPSSISSDYSKKSSSAVDTLNGNEIYEHLGLFINVGESGAEIVEDIIRSLGIYNINEALEISYESDDDGRVKNLVVIEESFFEGVNWEYQLTITDARSESEEDGGNAMQIFWNRNPRKGIAIIKPFNLDRNSDEYFSTAVFRIDYSEAGERGYDAHMGVAVSGLPLAHPLENPYSMNAMKMFVGKKGEIVDVYGNSNHPNAVFFSTQTGFNWAFVAAGHETRDLGVAEVGLPPSNLDEPSRDVLLGDYAIKNVFSAQIFNLWPYIDEETVDAYLYNTEAPGYFDSYGFVQGGESPGEEYDILESRLPAMSPYNPKEIHELELEFKTN